MQRSIKRRNREWTKGFRNRKARKRYKRLVRQDMKRNGYTFGIGYVLNPRGKRDKY